MLFYDGYGRNSVGIGLAISSENPTLPTYSLGNHTFNSKSGPQSSTASCSTILPLNGNAGRAFYNNNVAGNYTYSAVCFGKTVNN